MSNARNLANFKPSASGQVEAGDIADDAVGIAQLSATGTPSSSTFLRGDNSWQSVPSPTPGGSNTYVQYNNSGSFGGSANFVFDGTNVTIGATSNAYGGVLGVFSSGNTRFDVATTSATGQQIVSFGQNGTAKWQVISDLAASGSGDLDFVVPGVGSKFKFNSSGAIGLAGSNYGTSGQVLTSAGSGAAPSWQTVSSSPTTAQVLSATAGLTITSVQAPVGAYALLINRGSSNDYNMGNTLGGSVLQGVGCAGNNGSTFQTGTWRCMGFSNDVNNSNASTLWIRIS